MASTVGRMPPSRKDPPSIASCSRVTSTGRKLTYELRVIQQPERARACGSGAKSCADRRPVDPPPVVELRIFEGVGEAREDITFGYGANFFLFATLEVARPMAHGRVPQTSAPQIPVLTGMPVSGMAYLDRPSEAGYFIFPDLSVRHEGRYLLSFNLYEETKDGKDRDPDGPEAKGPGPALSDPSFDWRLEIKSDMFTVFSAKKFPGLTESTSLSRTVAEQGCRVRIRRDVRMRRRDGKGGGDGDAPEDEYAARAARRSVERDAFIRSRSGSLDGRPPIAPYHDGYPSASKSPAEPHALRPVGGYLSGGGFDHQNSAGQFVAPAQAPPAPPPPQQPPPPPHHHPPPPPPPPPQHAPPPGYPPPGPPPQDPRYPPPPPPSQHYGYDRSHPAPAYPAEPPFRERELLEQAGFRRGSETSLPPHYPPAPYPAPPNAPYHGGDPYQSRPPVQAYAPPPPPPPPQSPAVPRLPPLRTLSEKPEPLHSSPTTLSSLTRYPHSTRSPPSYGQYPSPPPLVPSLAASSPPAEPQRTGSKRSFDATFSSSAITQPLHNGMRPGNAYGGPAFDEDDEEDECNPPKMSYKRADGSDFIRTLPAQA